MASLTMYLYGRDPGEVLALLNDDEEIAFLVTDGPGQWKAASRLEALQRGKYQLWHIPSGPLPILASTGHEPAWWLADPWSGWQEERLGYDTSVPYFGAGHHGIIELSLKNELNGSENSVGLSSFGWIGHYYAVLGEKPVPETQNWWKRLVRSTKRQSIPLPRGGPGGIGKADVQTFPDAVQAIQNGVRAELYP